FLRLVFPGRFWQPLGRAHPVRPLTFGVLELLFGPTAGVAKHLPQYLRLAELRGDAMALEHPGDGARIAPKHWQPWPLPAALLAVPLNGGPVRFGRVIFGRCPGDDSHGVLAVPNLGADPLEPLRVLQRRVVALCTVEPEIPFMPFGRYTECPSL